MKFRNLLNISLVVFCLGISSQGRAERNVPLPPLPQLPVMSPENYRIDEIRRLDVEANGGYMIGGMGENQDMVPRPGSPIGFRFIQVSLPGGLVAAKHCFDLAQLLMNGAAGSNQSGMSLYIQKRHFYVCGSQTNPGQPPIVVPPVIGAFDPFSVAVRPCARGVQPVASSELSCSLRSRYERY